MTYFLTLYIISSITQFFLQNWKKLTLYPFIKRRAHLISKIIVPLVSFPFSGELIKGVCLIKWIVILIKFSLNIMCGFRQGHCTQHSPLHWEKHPCAGMQLEVFWKVAQSLWKCRPPWLADEEDFRLQND